MRQDNNLFFCALCQRTYIQEEYDNHVCQKIVLTVFDTEGNRWASYDRITFFRLPSLLSPTNANNHHRTTVFRTEPLSGSENHYMVVNTGIDQGLYITSEYH